MFLLSLRVSKNIIFRFTEGSHLRGSISENFVVFNNDMIQNDVPFLVVQKRAVMS